jgi:hypothetical protein
MNIRKRDVSLEVSELSTITAALGVKLKLFVKNPDGLLEPQLLGDIASDVTVQLVHRGGTIGRTLRSSYRQARVDRSPIFRGWAKGVNPEGRCRDSCPRKVRGDKANINSNTNTLGTYAPHG